MWPFKKTKDEKYWDAKIQYETLRKLLDRFHSLSDQQINKLFQAELRMEKYSKNRALDKTAKIIPIRDYNEKKRTD